MISYKRAKRVVVALLGGTVLLLGIAMIVLPGPAFVVVPAGLAILATEFEWARRWLRKAKERLARSKSKPATQI
jgi:tellurite resistance protein TerC